MIASDEGASQVGLAPVTAEAARVLEEFFDSQQRLVRVSNGRALSVPAIGAVNDWLAAEGRERISQTAIGRGMRALGIDSAKSNGKRYYMGLAFTHAPA